MDASMMPARSVRALRWWNASALSGLNHRIGTAWRQWCTGWGFAGAAVRCANARESGVLYGTVRHWFGAGALDDDGVWIGIPGHEPSEWVCRGAFGAVSGPSPLAARVANEAWQDLLREMAAALGADAVADGGALPTGLPAGHRLPWSGAVTAALAVNGLALDPLVVHIGPSAAARCCAASAGATGSENKPREALTGVAQALGHRSVALDVQLGDAEIELGMLQSLRIGDVVVLSHTLEQPATVSWPAGDDQAQGPTLFDGHLGRLGARKAVQIVAHRVPTPRTP